MSRFVFPIKAEKFIAALDDESVTLCLTDPPYFGITDEDWDNQWESEDEFVEWLVGIFVMLLPKLTKHGSLLFFGGVGVHGCHPFFRVWFELEKLGYHYRNLITWKKRRAYGKDDDYLFVREEIVWLSKTAPPKSGKKANRTVTFNKPYTDELRGYEGFSRAEVVGYVDVCYHIHHETSVRTEGCLSPRTQAQSERDVLSLLRQMDLLQRSSIEGAQTQEVGGQEQGSPLQVPKSLGSQKPRQESFGVGQKGGQGQRYYIRIDRSRLDGSVDGHLPSVWIPNPSERQEGIQLPVSGPDRQLCWVCTREHLRHLLAGQQDQIGCFCGGTRKSGSVFAPDRVVEKIALTKMVVSYPALSPYKRVGNVITDMPLPELIIDDIPELFKPERRCQKPPALMARFIETHSNPGDLVIDPFAGLGATVSESIRLGRRSWGCDMDPVAAEEANHRAIKAYCERT